MPRLRPLLPVVSEGSQSKTTPLTGPKGRHAGALPTCPRCSQFPEKAELTLASGPLLFPLPEMVFLGSCSTCRAQCSWHLPDPLTSERCLFPTPLPGGAHLPSITLALFCNHFVYGHFLCYTMSPVKITTEVPNNDRKRRWKRSR